MRFPSPSVFCKVCLLPHDEEIHEATLAVRSWHRDQVTRHLEVTDEIDEAVAIEEFEEARVA